MTDWADDEGKRVAQDGWLDSKPLHEHIAAALRKAKADGMREAADVARDVRFSVRQGKNAQAHIEKLLRDRASRVEQPR